MKGYELSPEATDDLQEIWVYIANDNAAAADKLEEDIYAACEMVAKNPRLGHGRSDLTDEPVLFWTVRGQEMVILPARSGAAEDRPHSSGRQKRLGSTLSVPKRLPSSKCQDRRG
jgi:plasmid stabilization system protein ParE